MIDQINIELPKGKKAYFASDFHLGSPNMAASRERELQIVEWLEYISQDAGLVVFNGDIFDFWFEYKYVVPKGYIRFLGKVCELSDNGVPVLFFHGNHDMWMFDYLKDELGAQIFSDPIDIKINESLIHIGHGDGLGPGDLKYKLLKKVFRSKVAQWLFARVHPNFAFWVATEWSGSSKKHQPKKDLINWGTKEWLYQYSMERQKERKRDYYIYGHRHMPMVIDMYGEAKYINIGEWMNNTNTSACFDQGRCVLLKYKGKSNPAEPFCDC